MYQRTLSEWEIRGQKLDMEYLELMSRVNYLADEVRPVILDGVISTTVSLLVRSSWRNDLGSLSFVFYLPS